MNVRATLHALGLLALLAVTLAAAPVLETGEINGAHYRIDIPDNWNGLLVMYCHGYMPVPGKYGTAAPNPVMAALLKEGYAVAQSGYAAGGWAIQEAMQDTEALRRHFIAKHGPPRETYVMGHSMGGFLTMMFMERFPNVYHGGLALCAPLKAASEFLAERAFHPRVVFDYYFPGALPSPVKVPPDYAMSKELTERLVQLLESKPEAAERVRRYSGILTNKELAGGMAFFTYILKDLQQRAGGNPFDNRGAIYDGSGDDDALNDGVARYIADPGAAAYVRAWATPTGRLSRPMLAIHNTYDALLPPPMANNYLYLSDHAGSAAHFVLQYVKRPGHCAITPEETVTGLNSVRTWASGGPPPPSGVAR